MKRRMNFSGRRRILRNQCIFTLRPDQSRGMNLDCSIDLRGVPCEGDCVVYLEVHRSQQLKRFNLGPLLPEVNATSLDVSGFEDDAGLGITIKVVRSDLDSKPIVALARNLAIGVDDDGIANRPLLAVRRVRIDSRLWRIDPCFDSGPFLEVSDRVVDWRHFVRSRQFLALAMPSAIRDVLIELLLVQKHEVGDDSSDSMGDRWLEFFGSLIGEDGPPELDDPGVVMQWIDSAVEAFTADRGLADAIGLDSDGDVW